MMRSHLSLLLFIGLLPAISAWLPAALPTHRQTARAGARQRAPAMSSMPAGEKYGENRVQVITDIDDTVKSSGGVRLFWRVGPALGGIDTQYKRGDFYPGVFQFGLELASFGLPPNKEPAPLAVLTARARELKLFLALKPKTKLCVQYVKAATETFESWGIGSPRWGVDCERTVLYGSVMEWILQFRKGWRKFDNFKKLKEMNDERTRYVLVGDTGEYDFECGERMAEFCPELVKGMFFHVVSEHDWKEAGEDGIPMPIDRYLNGVPVCYFRTYVGAARKAFRIKLIGVDEYLRIICAAQSALEQVDRPVTAGREDLKWKDLQRDIDLSYVEIGRFLRQQTPSSPAAAEVQETEQPKQGWKERAKTKLREAIGVLESLQRK
ncbi:hypothetical protein GUITHDRAFT_136302 [Guillardia theta CCMP2712]|uniref:Phosphatidate phosphatase APP1 catalytic domain-containing protein n=1 Tax=Guillardia theta (strain CCMP2712) TaxID=905079 RepID=L1JKW1_GUITC|nr:hypothetical protein GUITHDRAFT_136302 [Guillardia theta CCMP2712]EKX49138.1 hypothetical protein GUITHDRAFT_136302 [Guillardia theta CCMP2712]|eukprot:XP_005836118.1 hypothetical protein GUITHDRAFT_136302 [Guillardia theta CCMP2712]